MDIYDAIADPTRRRILLALTGGPCTVTELVDAVGYHQPGVSRHLRVLLDVGLVQVQPDGQRRVYSLCLEPFLDLEAWVQQHVRSFVGRLDRLGKVVEDAP
jgi:DNA-binding transcriptional ArsR family regulator